MKTHILAATLVAAAMAGINPVHAGEPAEAPGTRIDAAPKQEIRLERVTPEYWRVTLDNPPFNLFGPETIPQLNSVITQMESDSHVKVVVFQSAVPGFFFTHYDFVPPLSATTDIPPGVTGLPAHGSLEGLTKTISQGVATPKKHLGAMPPLGGSPLSAADLKACPPTCSRSVTRIELETVKK